MRRIGLFAAVLTLFGLSPVLAQTQDKVYRLAILAESARSLESVRNFTLPELAKLGFTRGQNLSVEAYAGAEDQLPGLAQELIALNPDAVLAIGNTAVHAARAATGTLPIVMYGADPIEQGFAASLARPGGNVTGVVILAAELDDKRFQLLREAVPEGRRIAVLVQPSTINPEARQLEARQQEMRAVAASVGSELLFFDVTGPEDYPAAFAAMRAAGAQALVIGTRPQFYENTALLVRLALQTGLPTACQWREMAEQGCLFSYGPSRAELYRRTADLIARIFRGAPAGALPVEQPTTIDFVINLRTAQALGLTVPPSVLARADEVIE